MGRAAIDYTAKSYIALSIAPPLTATGKSGAYSDLHVNVEDLIVEGYGSWPDGAPLTSASSGRRG